MPREYLIDYRNKHGLKSVEMAKMLDLSESYYNQIENGNRQKKMDIALVVLISNVTGIPMQEIIERETEPEGVIT